MRLIDADALLLDNIWEFFDDWGNYTGAGQIVADAPTIDAVEVVRCKDCQWYDKGENEVSTWSICTRTMGISDSVIDTDYCSFVERKEESEVDE